MDYIVFHLDNSSMKDFKVNFGSGLNSNNPGKCPLTRNLKDPLLGDQETQNQEDDN